MIQRSATVICLAWFAALTAPLAQPLQREQCQGIGDATPDPDEARAIAVSGNRVARDGCVLRVRTNTGEQTFNDDLREGGHYVRYLYQGRLPRTDFDIVRVQFYEGSAYQLIGPRGWSRLVGAPVLSPDGRRVIAASRDLYASYNPNAVEIWNIERGLPVLELSVRTDRWGPGEVTWIDADTIGLVLISLDDQNQERLIGGARMRRTSAGWSFDPAQP
jgi:hypothetical protein